MNALYLSYDGMTDPLGRSQVMPYLIGLAAKGHQITLVSCEKPDRYAEGRVAVAAILLAARIDWQPIVYHKRPPVLSTLWDVSQMRRQALRIFKAQHFDLVHCRSYIPSLVGLELKRRFGVAFIFDMRGFWADERVDGGLWSLKNPLYQLIYRFFKRKELQFLKEADRTISLTHAGKKEIQRWAIPTETSGRIEVIPCCADLAHFSRDQISEEQRAQLREELQLSDSDFVVTYLGSLGTWYLLDEMLLFFKRFSEKRSEARFLFITPDEPEQIFKAAERLGVPRERLRIRRATREQVPPMLSLSQLGLFFIKPSYSKISSSPTKMAEYLAMGLPVVTNSGVGDNEWIASRYEVEQVVNGFEMPEFDKAIAGLARLQDLAPERVRAAAQDYFSLEGGVARYHSIYSSLESSMSGRETPRK